jgi:serine/threonine protein kinase
MFGADPLGADARSRDIYSLGCTIYEIYTGKPPSAIMDAVLHGRNPTLPPEGGPWTEEEVELWGYVGMCLNADAEARPNIKLLRNALWDIKNWTISCFPPMEPGPEFIAPGLDRVQDWLKQAVRTFSVPFSFDPDVHPSSSSLTSFRIRIFSTGQRKPNLLLNKFLLRSGLEACTHPTHLIIAGFQIWNRRNPTIPFPGLSPGPQTCYDYPVLEHRLFLLRR